MLEQHGDPEDGGRSISTGTNAGPPDKVTVRVDPLDRDTGAANFTTPPTKLTTATALPSTEAVADVAVVLSPSVDMPPIAPHKHARVAVPLDMPSTAGSGSPFRDFAATPVC